MVLARFTAEAELVGYAMDIQRLREEKPLAGMMTWIEIETEAGDPNASTQIAIRSKDSLLNGNIQIEAAVNGLDLRLTPDHMASKTVELSADLLAAYFALPNKDRSETAGKAPGVFSIEKSLLPFQLPTEIILIDLLYAHQWHRPIEACHRE